MFRKHLRESRMPSIVVHDDAGGELLVTKQDALGAALLSTPASRDWQLALRHRVLLPTRSNVASPGRLQKLEQAPQPAILSGPAAQRALAAILPHANVAGGTARSVRSAVAVIESHSSLDALVYSASMAGQPPIARSDPNPFTNIPERMRLALEMVLHEDDERRAMEGELRLLEQRWREADEIAKIADALLIPSETEERLRKLRAKAEQRRSGG